MKRSYILLRIKLLSGEMNSKFENSVKVSEGERLTDTCWNDFLNQSPVIFVNISFSYKE